MTQRTYTHTTGKPTTSKTKATKMEVLGVIGIFVILGALLAIAIICEDGSPLKEFAAKWLLPFSIPTYLFGCGIYCALKGEK